MAGLSGRPVALKHRSRPRAVAISVGGRVTLGASLATRFDESWLTLVNRDLQSMIRIGPVANA